MTVTGLFKLGESLISRIWPDPEQQARELRKLEELKQKGDLAELEAHVKLMLAQVEVNKLEAQSKSLFVAGWRPAVGWAGAIALALSVIQKALVITMMWTYQAYIVMSGVPDLTPPDYVLPDLPPFPDLGTGDVVAILGAMLGIGTMRSLDKRAGKQTDSLG